MTKLMGNEDMSNLDLWNKVAKTDPTYTKAFNQGFSGTSINSTYLVMKATEQWGMIGIGWGYEIVEERIDVGAPVYNKEGAEIGSTKTHTIVLCLWVRQGSEYSRVTHFGHTKYIYYSSKNGYWITDEEAPKKSLTDALKKCLSMHGFSADIFLGLYDDKGYVEAVKAESLLDKADDKAAEALRQKQEYLIILDKNLELISTATSMNELEALYKSIIRKSTRMNDEAGMRKVNTAKDKRKTELGEKK